MKSILYVCCVLIFTFSFATNGYGMGNESPWSDKEFSKNKEYVFVLLSKGSLNDYEIETREGWEPLRLSPQELRKYESNLSRSIQEELEIRRTYPNSGLYKVGNNTSRLLSVEPQDAGNWTSIMEKIYVADDGTYVIGFNPHITMGKNDIANKEEVGIFICSPSFASKSYTVSVLTNGLDSFTRTSDSYFWAYDNLVFDDQKKTVTLIKGNESKLQFDLTSGELLTNITKTNCTFLQGLILLIVIGVSITR